MRICYLFAPVEPGCVGPESGIEKKVRSQCQALSCELMILPPVEYKNSMSEKLLRRLPCAPGWRKWKYNGEFNEYDAVYIRAVYEDQAFIRYLSAIKRTNPAIKILYEVPTYPEKTKEKITVSSVSFMLKKYFARRKLKRYVDRIITFYGQDTIYGIDCIKMINGFDFSNITIPKRQKEKAIHIISVAINASWHGYERLIKGIEAYYKNGVTEEIVYHLVGPALPEYGRSTDHVILHGSMYGSELKALYKKCVIAIDVLGGHRKDYPVSSSLKSREYAAYGLPIVTASPIDYLPKEYPYQYIVPYDDSPIDVEGLLEWCHQLYDNHDVNSIAEDIRSFAISKCDMSNTIQPVIDYLNSTFPIG